MGVRVEHNENNIDTSKWTTAKALKVGFFPSAKYETGVQVAQVAFWQEFGTINIPPRPFMRNAIAQNKEKWGDLFAAQLKNSTDAETALNTVGEIARGDVLMSLTSLSSPPLKPSTIAKKGSSNPLIDTGHLKNSLSFEVS